MAHVVGVAPPARSVWFDMAGMVESVLGPGEEAPGDPAGGFLWIDLELTAEVELATLAEHDALPATPVDAGRPGGEVRWTVGADCVHIDLAGARLDGDRLTLDRRQVVIGEGVVASIHRGAPDHFDRLRDRYADSFATFAKSHGFLLFEMFGVLLDDLRDAVRDLGDRIDEHRMSTAGRTEAASSSDLLASVLLLRRILVRTRDLLTELSSRRSRFVPETTQPYLGDMATRLDGMIEDLAFSRDVLSEAMTAWAGEDDLATVDSPRSSREARRRADAARAPLRFIGLGGFAVLSGTTPIPADAFEGGARPLLAALLCARGPVPLETLHGWLWPERKTGSRSDELEDAASALRRALAAGGRPAGDAEVLVADDASMRIELVAGDSWDVGELLALAAGEDLPAGSADRLRVLGSALETAGRPLYPEWPHADWAATTRDDLARAALAIRSALAEELLAAGRAADALAHYTRLAEEEPAREAWHRGIMRCHAAAGDRALALRQFHTCRSVLRQSHGREPGTETQALYIELLRSRHPGRGTAD